MNWYHAHLLVPPPSDLLFSPVNGSHEMFTFISISFLIARLLKLNQMLQVHSHTLICNVIMDYKVTGLDNSTIKVHLNITYSLIFSRIGGSGRCLSSQEMISFSSQLFDLSPPHYGQLSCFNKEFHCEQWFKEIRLSSSVSF